MNWIKVESTEKPKVLETVCTTTYFRKNIIQTKKEDSDVIYYVYDETIIDNEYESLINALYEENEKMNSIIEQYKSNVEYLAMMSGVDLDV